VIPISSVSPSAGAVDAAKEAAATADDASIPLGSWANAAGNLANMPSQCGNASYLSAKPDEDLLIASVALDGLWGSRDGGKSWSQLGTGSDASPPITNRGSSIVYDPTNTLRYWESGIYNVGGVFETTDDGTTFSELGENGILAADLHGIDLVSIDFSDPERQTLLAGGHEEPQTLYRSTNGGTTWSNVGGDLPLKSPCSFPLVIDSRTYLVGCDGEFGGPAGVYLSTDSGTTWTSTTSLGGIDAPLVATDGSIYWSSPNAAGIARSTDQGRTWVNVVGPNTVLSMHPIELPDGRIATIGPQYGPQYVLLTADHGATWTPVTPALPYGDAVGVTYSSQRQAFYIWHFTCGTGNVPVPSDAIMSFNFDYRKN
jgi:photosystem II stability/assembly factor-like uncharacterized protein